MKKITLFAIVMIAGFTINLNAQTATSATTSAATAASADLLTAMTLTQTSALNFGASVLSGTTGGTVVLPSNSTSRTYSGTVASSAATPSPTNAAYNVVGTANETYALTLPATTTVTHATVTTGVYQMDITDMKARFASASSADAVIGLLSSTGTDSFTVGGTLTVKASQIGGEYSGTFNVSVDYN